MSKYTTEVRFICESYAGRIESAGIDDVGEIIDKSYDKIFDVDGINVYNAEHKPLLLKKILLHYYTREIGLETVGLWKLHLNNKLKEIMPYYNQLYKSETLKYDPLQNVNNEHLHTGLFEETSKVDKNKDYSDTKDTANSQIANKTSKYDNTTNTNDSKVDSKTLSNSELANEEVNNTYSKNEDTELNHGKTTTRGNDTVTTDGERGRDSWTLYSDTPQGGIEGLQTAPLGTGNVGNDNNNYLTNATHIIDKTGKDVQTTVHGQITDKYDGSTDKVETEGEENGTSEYNRNFSESEEKAGVAEGKRVDNAKTVDDSSKAFNEKQTDVSNTVEDNTRKDNGTDSYENKEIGKIGVMTYPEMVRKWRESFLNIDMMIINELSDLFMKVW